MEDTGTTPFPIDKKLNDVKDKLCHVIMAKFFNNLQITFGTENDRNRWGKILVNWGKEKQFMQQCNTGFLDEGARYGKILDSGYGDNIPIYSDVVNKFFKDFNEKLVLMKLKTGDIEKTYYVENMHASGKEQILSASSVEDLKRYGKILYCSTHKDPPEALVHVIEDRYFELADYEPVSDSKPFEWSRNGDLQNVKKYLQDGGDVNITDEYGWTMLHHAALGEKNMELISFLINKGANIQAQDKMCGRTPAHIAAREGHRDFLDFCFDRGISVDVCDKNNWTLLHYAVWKGDMATVQFLKQHGAEMCAKELSVGKQPIHVAAENGHTDVVEFLLADGATVEDKDNDWRTPLFYSLKTDGLNTSKLLIDRGADVTVKAKKGSSLLHSAAITKNREMIEFFLDAGLNIDEKNMYEQTPLVCAAINGNSVAAEVLVDMRADLNAIPKATLDFVAKTHINLFLYLMQQKGKGLEEQDKYRDALELYKETLSIATEKLGRDDLKSLEVEERVGKMLFQLGLYDEAVAAFEHVLAQRESQLDSTNLATLTTKHALALVYDAQAKYVEEIELLTDVVTKLTNTKGAGDDKTLDVHRDLAYAHFKRGEFNEACVMFQSVFEMRMKKFGAEHPKTLQSRHDIAVGMVNKGDRKAALRIFKAVLEKRKLILGDNHSDTLSTMKYIEIIERKN